MFIVKYGNASNFPLNYVPLSYSFNIISHNKTLTEQFHFYTKLHLHWQKKNRLQNTSIWRHTTFLLYNLCHTQHGIRRSSSVKDRAINEPVFTLPQSPLLLYYSYRFLTQYTHTDALFTPKCLLPFYMHSMEDDRV